MSEFVYAGSELDAMAGARNYYRALMERFGPHLGHRVVEVGAGIGTFADYLLAHPGVGELTLVEPAENNYPSLERRFAGRAGVRTIQGYLGELVGRVSADAVVAVNVLEHVEDDLGFLRDAHRILAPGGKLLLFVPAVPGIYGSLDRAFDHYRRYTRSVLDRLLATAGFRPVELRYANLPGVLSWFVAGRVLRRSTVTPRDVEVYDRWIMPWVSRLERVVAPPIGQSLVVVASR